MIAQLARRYQATTTRLAMAGVLPKAAREQARVFNVTTLPKAIGKWYNE